jgi:hypothetical protein
VPQVKQVTVQELNDLPTENAAIKQVTKSAFELTLETTVELKQRAEQAVNLQENLKG